MLQIRPVVQVKPWDEPAPWPVAALLAWSFMPLDGDRTDEEVGLFVAAVAGDDTLDDLLTSNEDRIVVGGLQIQDTVTGATVEPGCCCGLEDWRDWQNLATDPWLGHDPTPTVEHHGDRLRLWQNEQRRGPYVDIAVDALPGLLEHAHRDLNAFLTLTGRWAGRRGNALMTVLDHSFAITAPLEAR